MSTAKKQTRLILSISSDIGAALAEDWLAAGHAVWGTYRTWSPQCNLLQTKGARLVSCDLSQQDSIEQSMDDLKAMGFWDVLVLAAGDIAPFEAFHEVNFQAWRNSFELNFLGPMQFLHALLPSRHLTPTEKPIVLFFAGGGTNSAPVGSSAYTISKIALIKSCEMLDAEIPDTRFTILGPGWVKTKIHQAALHAGDKHPVRLKTIEMIERGEFFPMEKVVECCNWLVGSRRDVVSGRNFSAVYDKWGTEELTQALLANTNMYKLRRSGNEALTKEKK